MQRALHIAGRLLSVVYTACETTIDCSGGWGYHAKLLFTVLTQSLCPSVGPSLRWSWHENRQTPGI